MSRLLEQLTVTASLTYIIGRGAIFLALLLLIVTQFVLTMTRVEGKSMLPTLKDKQYLLIDRYTVRFGVLQRGDIVSLRFPGDPNQTKYIKRVVALPGERIAIQGGRFYINGQLLDEFYLEKPEMNAPDRQWELDGASYFLVGDNRNASSDSRVFGPIESRFIIGKLLLPL